MQWARKQNGFTIVELLVVIVVIAILAAITIVSYNGITARAYYAQQITALDKIGKAIQLYTADKGTSMAGSGAGYLGDGYGSFSGTTTTSGVNYTATSIEKLLRDEGYLSGSIAPLNATQVLLSPCTSLVNTRWVVFAIVTPAPQKPVADQISETNCTYSFLTLYTGPSYNRNLVKVY